MRKITFWKMSGSGNDFIVIDNRKGVVKEEEMSNFSKLLCRRKVSVGADGVIFIRDSDKYDFSWRFFNSDGSEAEMCGNGSRCAARFAYLNKIAPKKMIFETIAGHIMAEVLGRRVKVLLPEPKDLRMDLDIEKMMDWKSIDFINTGVPHVVVMVDELESIPVQEIGRKIRFHKKFSPEGTNVNFMKKTGKDSIQIRTYERGVEDETLACGTGSVACALISSIRYEMQSPIDVLTKGGEVLRIYFKREGKKFYDVWLEGDTNIVYKGELHDEAFL